LYAKRKTYLSMHVDKHKLRFYSTKRRGFIYVNCSSIKGKESVQMHLKARTNA